MLHPLQCLYAQSEVIIPIQVSIQGLHALPCTLLNALYYLIFYFIIVVKGTDLHS